MSSLNAFAQKMQMTGKVSDDLNEPLIGVSVVVKGTTVGTITDIDGNFSIEVPNKKSVLVFSFMGLRTQEIPVGNNTFLNVKMKEDSQMIDEVVVVGFGTQKKENLTGAVKSVDTKVLESRPITSATSGLQGAVAGLNITNDNGGAPGQKMNINIRGAGTIGSGSTSSPLVLIDGVEGDLDLVNPNDIENISVLKDAAAASIYGSRAPFGVILVTTKGGKKGLSVTYSGNVRLNSPVNTPDPVDSYKYALFVNDACTNSGSGKNFSEDQIKKILAFQNGTSLPGEEWGTAAAPDSTKWLWEDGCWGNTDWYDVYLKKHSYSQEHNLNLSGGTDKLTYYVSGRYYNQSGLYNYAEEDYNTLTLNGSFDFKVNKYITFGWNTRLINEEKNKPTVMDDLFFHQVGRSYPLVPVKVPNGEYNPYSMIQALQDGGQEIKKNQLLYNQLRLTIEPIKDWKIYLDYSNRSETPNSTRQYKKIFRTNPNGTVEGQRLFGDNPTKKVFANGGFYIIPEPGTNFYEVANGKVSYHNFNARTDYENRWGKHYFKVLVGTQIESFYTETLRVGSSNILSDDNPFIPVDSEDILRSHKKGKWTTVGIFTRLNYSFADRYLFEVNMRADAASRFPKNQRWGYFPSFSLGWNIAQENFFENLRDKGFDMLKLRGSYGSLGNQNTESFYPYYQEVTSGLEDYVINGSQVNVIYVPKPFAKNITWETIQTTDVGMDIAFLSNRLSASFDWYERLTKDMVGPSKALPNVFGTNSPLSNNAELRTRGWELELAWRDRINKNWSYSISASLSDYQSVVTKYDSPDGSIDESKDPKYYKGKKLGEIWGFRVKGIAQSDKEMDEWLAMHDQSSLGSDWGGGDFMYYNLDDDSSINEGAKTIYNPGDCTIIGNSTPRYQYGVRGSLTWKYLDFSMFWQGIGKRDMYIGASTFFGMSSLWQRSIFEDHMDYFRYADHPLGANMDSYYARPHLNRDESKPGNNNYTNDHYLQNASYVRLKNVTIGYTLPQNTRLNKWVKTLRVYVSGENLLTFTKLKVFDPESIGLSTATYGIGKTYPMFCTFSAGLSITL